MLLRKSLELTLKSDEKPSEENANVDNMVTPDSAVAIADPKPLSKDVDENAHQLYTCETAQYFFLQDVLPRWEKFISEAAKLLKDVERKERIGSRFVRENFPFTSFITGQSSPSKDLVQRIFPVSS